LWRGKDSHMICLIGRILTSAIHNLFSIQPDILTNTLQTGMTEWNLGHHLANEIAKYIFWLNHDLDVTKRNYENRRPDIIFHKRGINVLNYLVIEIKRTGSINDDIRKIREGWMSSDLHYRFGASVVIKSADNFRVKVFEKGKSQTQLKFDYKTPAINCPSPDGTLRRQLYDYVSQIYACEKMKIESSVMQRHSSTADTSALERQIDEMAYKLYNLTQEEIIVVENSTK